MKHRGFAKAKRRDSVNENGHSCPPIPLHSSTDTEPSNKVWDAWTSAFGNEQPDMSSTLM